MNQFEARFICHDAKKSLFQKAGKDEINENEKLIQNSRNSKKINNLRRALNDELLISDIYFTEQEENARDQLMDNALNRDGICILVNLDNELAHSLRMKI
jgi:transcriptional regulator of met regulon